MDVQDMEETQVKWNNTPSSAYEEESDSEEEAEMAQEERPVPEVDEEFRKRVMDLKHSLYDNTVLAPPLGTADAQSNKPLDDYMGHIHRVYLLSMGAQKGLQAKQITLAKFPLETQEKVQGVLRWIADFFPKNGVVKTIPYEDFLRNSFHVYPFYQN